MRDQDGAGGAVTEIIRRGGPAGGESHVEAVSRAELADRANAEHRASMEAFRSALEHARAAGEALIEAKERTAHGEWLDWLEDNFDATRQTATNYMRIARRWPELAAAEGEMENELSIRRALGLLAGSSDEDEDEKRSHAGKEAAARKKIDAAYEELPDDERDRARDLLSRAEAPTIRMSQVTQRFVELPPDVRLALYLMNESTDPDEWKRAAEEAGLPRRDAVLKQLPGDLHFALRKIVTKGFHRDTEDVARPVMSLQAILRLTVAFWARTDYREVIEGLPHVRNPAKMAADARRTAEWLNRMASRVEQV